MDIPLKSFDELVKENAGCFEFAWNGFIRIYEDGEKRCECTDCNAIKELNDKIDKFMNRKSVRFID